MHQNMNPLIRGRKYISLVFLCHDETNRNDILRVILFEYTEGHHDPPLVTLFVVTELDLCRHDPDGMSFDIIININYVCSEKV